MSHKAAVALLSSLTEGAAGVFHIADAKGVSRKQIAALRAAGVIVREHPGVYRIAAVPASNDQRLRAALLWAGETAAAAGRSAGELYELDGVTTAKPEIVVPPHRRARSDALIVHHSHDRGALMLRTIRGVRVTGVEPTLVALAHALDPEAFEIAFEDARRRRLTSVAAVNAYLDRWGRSGRPGVAATRALVAELDPVHPARKRLEVKTRRLLVAHGHTDFVREFPLSWHRRTYYFDYAFEQARVILEVNGRRWHDDPDDYEFDQEKWSVPARHGYRLLFATWSKVTKTPGALIDELRAALAAGPLAG
jgi:very-short-patch-repair endonuclease